MSDDKPFLPWVEKVISPLQLGSWGVDRGKKIYSFTLWDNLITLSSFVPGDYGSYREVLIHSVDCTDGKLTREDRLMYMREAEEWIYKNDVDFLTDAERLVLAAR